MAFQKNFFALSALFLTFAPLAWSVGEEDLTHLKSTIRAMGAPLFGKLTPTRMAHTLQKIFWTRINTCEDFECLKAYEAASQNFSRFMDQTFASYQDIFAEWHEKDEAWIEDEAPVQQRKELFLKIKKFLDVTFIHPMLQDQIQRVGNCLKEKDPSHEALQVLEKSAAFLSLFGNTPPQEESFMPEKLRYDFLKLLDHLEDDAHPDPLDIYRPPHKPHPRSVKMRQFETFKDYVIEELEDFIHLHLAELQENCNALINQMSWQQKERFYTLLNEFDKSVRVCENTSNSTRAARRTFKIYCFIQEFLETPWVENKPDFLEEDLALLMTEIPPQKRTWGQKVQEGLHRLSRKG